MNILKSKTMLFSLLLAVLGTVEQNTTMVTSIVGPENTGLAMLGISVIVAILRIVTTEPLSAKQ